MVTEFVSERPAADVTVLSPHVHVVFSETSLRGIVSTSILTMAMKASVERLPFKHVTACRHVCF